jgi:hypothetical protein
MSLRNLLLLLPTLIWTFCPAPVMAASARILKVLPLFVDEEGRSALSPSLFERDVYQAMLAKHPEQQAGMRYTVHWKLTTAQPTTAVLRLELRGTKTHRLEPLIIEQPVKKSGWFGRWTSFDLKTIPFHELGPIVAWRVSLYSDDLCLAEQKSFLW